MTHLKILQILREPVAASSKREVELFADASMN